MIGRFATHGLLVVGALACASCTRPRTQIMAQLRTDMTQGPGAELPAIRVQVTGEEAGALHYDQTLQLGPGGVTLPQELGLVPGRSKSALVTVQVDALDGSGAVVFTKHVSAHYVPGKTLTLDIFLASRCLAPAARTCPGGQSCGATGCESDLREDLPPYGGPPTDDGGTRDLGVPADLAGSVDLFGADLVVQNDLAVEGDLAVQSDLAVADDLAIDSDLGAPDLWTADLTVPADLNFPDLKILPDLTAQDLSGVPVITNVSPSTVVIGLGGYAITITGTRLDTGTPIVLINGVAQTLSSVTATEIVINQINASTAPGAPADLVVVTTGGEASATLTVLARLAMVSATGTSPTQVSVTFNRDVDASTIQADRFTIPGLTVSGASVAGSTVTLTASAQVDGTGYALHTSPLVLDLLGTAAIDYMVPFNGPLPTEFVVVVAGDGTSAGSLSVPVALERRSLATPTTLIGTLTMPSLAAADPLPFTLMINNSAEGVLTRSPDGKTLAMMGYQTATGTAGSGNTPPGGVSRAAAVIDLGDFATPAGVVVIPTNVYTNAQARSAVVDGNNLWVGGGSEGIFYRPLTSSSAFTSITTTPAAARSMGIFGGQLFETTSITLGLYAVGSGTPTTSVGTATLVDSDTNSGTPYGFAVFDVSDEPGLDLLYLFDEAAGIKRFAKAGGDWTLKTTFSNGIRQGTCYLDGADAVCIGASSAGIHVFRDVGRSLSGSSLGAAKVTVTSGFQYRGLALAPAP